jgi:prefoldin subunit 5
MNAGLQRATISFLVATFVHAAVAAEPTAEATAVAVSGLEFGGSVGKLLWVTQQNVRDNATRADADAYTQLARRVKDQIDAGRASSGVVKANFDVAAATLGYAAAVDPEPMTKVAAGLSAWGAKKLGDSVASMVVEQSETDAMKVIAQGLKNSGLSAADLRNMKPEELRSRVADFQIGGAKMRDILKDEPKALEMLQAHAADLATNISVEALARAEGTAEDVQAIRKKLVDNAERIDKFHKDVQQRLENVSDRITGLADATQEAAQKLDDLRKEVGTNTAAIQTLAQISYAGWSTTQKLQAVKSGLFPELTASQTDKLIASLEATRKQEALIAGAQSAASDFGNLAAIAGSIGMPRETVTALQGAQTLSVSIARFAGGDVLGGIAGLTSLGGLGAPDAAAERHRAMMAYLAQQFEVINKKLNTIIDLQVRTLNAIDELSKQQQSFRREVLGQLDRIEDTVLGNQTLMQAVLLGKWAECDALINGPFNRRFTIDSRNALVSLVKHPDVPRYTTQCYHQMATFLDAYVKQPNWQGQVIAADSFPQETIAADPQLQAQWTALQHIESRAYSTAKAFVTSALPNVPKTTARALARFLQPVANDGGARQLEETLAKPEVRKALDEFRCGQRELVSPGIADILCTAREGLPPLETRWQEMLSPGLIGPYATHLVDIGITLARISDFSRRSGNDFVFVNADAIERFSQNGPTSEMLQGLREQKGMQLLARLRWLTDIVVLQQSIAYGEATAMLAERVLYDPATKALRTEAKTEQEQLALAAMRANPLLARNVVLLALRHATVDSLGGAAEAEKVRYRQTYYQLALEDFRGTQACNGSALSRAKLAELFPKWEFEYRVSTAQKQGDASLKPCPDVATVDLHSAAPAPPLGAGVAVRVADFYVLAPSPLVLSTGVFEQSEGLRRALSYRDRLSQEIVDRNVGTLLKEVSSRDPNAFGNRAFMLLNEGWEWQHREKGAAK